MRVSVVTITYNRKIELIKLYESLLKQNNKNFDWVIVDDGSIDLTHMFIKNVMEENLISIEYLKKENGGKHTGINCFLENSELKNELIFFVDSDDVLTDNAIEKILDEYHNLSNKAEFSSLCFLKLNKTTLKPLTKIFPKNKFDSNIFDLMKKHKIYGDKAEVFFKSELSKYRFPVIKNEKFMSELYIWMELSKNKKTRYINEGIYLATYLDDGYTKNFNKVLYNNPIGMSMYYTKILKHKAFGYILRGRAFLRIIQIKLIKFIF